jgi:hypothetical protein
LAGLLREQNAILRKRAFAALGSIRTAVARSAQAPLCRLAARIADTDGPKAGRRVLLAIAGDQGGAAPNLLPTQILLNEDGRMVTNYRVNPRPLPETLSVVFLLPRPESEGESQAAAALSCLPWKRPTDLWACTYYTSGATPLKPEENPPRFQAAADAIGAEFDRVPPQASCLDIWRSIWRSVEMDTAPVFGKRQLMIFGDGRTASAAGEDVVAAVAAAHAGVYVISPGPDPALEEFCRRVNGVFRDETAIVDSYLDPLAQYEIQYQAPAPEGRALKIRLHGPFARGEVTISHP